MQIAETKQDKRNQYGVIICGHCNKPGHGMANCWELHGRPPMQYNGNNGTKPRYGGEQGRPPRKCWNCGSTDHIASNCPRGTEHVKPKGNENVNNRGTENMNTKGTENVNDKEDDEQLNHLFIGTVWTEQSEYDEKPKPETWYEHRARKTKKRV